MNLDTLGGYRHYIGREGYRTRPNILAQAAQHPAIAFVGVLGLIGVGGLIDEPREGARKVSPAITEDKKVTTFSGHAPAPATEVERRGHFYRELKNYLTGLFKGEIVGRNPRSIASLMDNHTFFYQLEPELPVIPEIRVEPKEGLKTRWAPITSTPITELPQYHFREYGEILPDGSFKVVTAQRKEDGSIELTDWVARLGIDEWLFNAETYRRNGTSERLMKILQTSEASK